MSEQTQVITAALDAIVETGEEYNLLTDMTQTYEPPAGSMDRSNNQYWKPIKQNTNRQSGWDTTPGNPLELSISGSLGEPENVSNTLRADELRDERLIKRNMSAALRTLLEGVEQDAMQTAATYGSFCLPFAGAPGDGAGQVPVWDALAQAESRMFGSKLYTGDGTCSFINTQAYVAGGKSLVEGSANFRNSLPDDAYNKGQIQRQIAGVSDVYRHNTLYNLEAATTDSLTVNGNVSLKPLAKSVTPNNSGGFDNVDFRHGTIAINESLANVTIGSKFVIPSVKAVSSTPANIVQDYDQTFTVVNKDGANLVISPRPIWKDDPALSDAEKAYANIDSQIETGDALVFKNVVAQNASIIMAKDAMVLTSNPIPFANEMFQGLDAEPFQVGPISGMIGFESDLNSLTGAYRMAIWYNWQVERPEAIGTVLWNQSTP